MAMLRWTEVSPPERVWKIGLGKVIFHDLSSRQVLEVEYEKPGVILERLLVAELEGEFFNRETHERHEKVLEGVRSGIVRELMELQGMLG